MTGRSIELRRVQDAAVRGKTVLVRVDYNVPVQNGEIADDERIRSSLPTVRLLREGGAKVVLMTHLGRPEGRVVPELRLDAVGRRLQELLAHPVCKLDDSIGEAVASAIESGAPGDVFLLENVRFHREEAMNESSFARELSRLGDIYVNDAFAAVHRAHASTLGIADFLPAYAGLLMQREIEMLSKLLESPERPYIAIVGGKKARSKLGALRDLVHRVDEVLIGGGVAFSFLRATGASIGTSVVDEDLLDEVEDVIESAEELEKMIHLPGDVVAAQALEPGAETRTVKARSIPDGWMGLDIGPETIERFAERIAAAKTIVWTGPMGAFEVEPFSGGTRGIADAIAASDAYSVIGGGETGDAVSRLGRSKDVSFVSTGGGACLALLRGKSLPALEALRA